MTPGEIRAALERREVVPDADFDALYPEELRSRSDLQWTSVAIALRAAEYFTDGVEVLDVGSGAGKSCLIGRLSTGIRWWGVEREGVLVEAANQAAWQLGVRDDARFVHAEAWDLDWERFGAFYFFNPFPSLIDSPGNAFVRYGRFVAECVKAEQRLAALRPGTKIVTYHGFGGDMPDCYEQVAHEPVGTDALRVYIRR